MGHPVQAYLRKNAPIRSNLEHGLKLGPRKRNLGPMGQVGPFSGSPATSWVGAKWVRVGPKLQKCWIETESLDDVVPICKMRTLLQQGISFWRPRPGEHDPPKSTIMYFLGLKPKSYHNSIQTQQLNTKEIEDTPNNT